ncbi:GumC family protein [Salinisphaera aquimarina]|uniref:GumC family protein n=1 Tax=Salinisphaera aquimarina TaxID=2094031 RepID=A0ABV7EKK1_9GAMM
MGMAHSLVEQENDNRKRLALPAELEYIATASRMQDTVGLWDIFNTLWRRKGLILAVVASIMIAVSIVLLQISPTFRAQSLLIIGSRSPDVASLVNVAVGLPADPESIESEMVILRSPSLAKKVIDRLGLQDDPEFNPALRAPSWLAAKVTRYKRAIAVWSSNVFELGGPAVDEQSVVDAVSAPESGSQRSGAELADVIEAFLEKLEVSVQGNSRVLSVAFSSHSAETAAQVPNTLAKIYLQGQRDAKQEMARLDTELLNKRVDSLRTKVEAEDQAVESYRQKSGLLQSDQGSTLITQQLTDTSTQVTQAKIERAQAEARLEQIQKLAQTPAGIEASSEVMNSALIPYLREQEVQLLHRKGEMSAQYAPRHPAMVNIQRDIGALRSRIKNEEKRIVDGYRNDVAAARVRERTIQNRFDQLKAEVGQANEKEIKLRSLEREAEADRSLLATLLSRLKETRQQQGMDVQQADARIVSLADVPSSASFPKTGAMLALALVGSSLLGMLIVLISEQRDRGFRSSRQVEETMRMPVLGSVPKLGVFSKVRNRSIAYRLLDQSNVAVREAMRSIYESLLLSNRDGAPKSILITSSVANEGKTAIAVSLARMEAFTGANVLVVDTDLRSPDIHRAFNATESPGLVELVTGEAELDETLRKDPESGAWYVTAGRRTADPLTILTSERFGDLLGVLSGRFDLVIFDSPPSNMFLDARILSAKVEKTLFVVRWGETPQELVLEVFKRHAQSGAQLSGVVLSMTDGKRRSQYG